MKATAKLKFMEKVKKSGKNSWKVMDFEKLKRARTLLKHSHFNVRKIGKTKKTLLAACTIPFEHAPNSNVTEPRPCFQIECFLMSRKRDKRMAATQKIL